MFGYLHPISFIVLALGLSIIGVLMLLINRKKYNKATKLLLSLGIPCSIFAGLQEWADVYSQNKLIYIILTALLNISTLVLFVTLFVIAFNELKKNKLTRRNKTMIIVGFSMFIFVFLMFLLLFIFSK